MRLGFLAALVMLVLGQGPARATALTLGQIEAGLGFAEQQADRTLVQLGGNAAVYPRCCGDGGAWSVVGPSDWTSGFWPQELTSLYRATGDAAWLGAAVAATLPLAGIPAAGDADIGMQMAGFGALYSLTGNAAYKSVLLQAGAALAGRYNPLVGGINQWNSGPGVFTLLVDGMNDLRPLAWGGMNGGNPAWLAEAKQNAATVAATLVRANGSTYQMANYDPATGQMTFLGTYNGYSNTSDWQRGLAWGMNGFADLYAQTGDATDLQEAELLADHFIAVQPADCVSYWDTADPAGSGALRDTSATALGDLALTKLSVLAGGSADRTRYEAGASCGLESLMTAYQAPGSGDAVLKQGNAPDGKNVALIYGDASFVTALAAQQDLALGQPIGWTMSYDYTPIPEPASFALLGFAVVAMVGALRARR